MRRPWSIPAVAAPGRDSSVDVSRPPASTPGGQNHRGAGDRLEDRQLAALILEKTKVFVGRGAGRHAIRRIIPSIPGGRVTRTRDEDIRPVAWERLELDEEGD